MDVFSLFFFFFFLLPSPLIRCIKMDLEITMDSEFHKQILGILEMGAVEKKKKKKTYTQHDTSQRCECKIAYEKRQKVSLLLC